MHAFLEAMGAVATAIEQQFEREQVEWVFGLTGGELEKEPLQYRDPNATYFGPDHVFSYRYHYEGVPEWAASDFGSQYSGYRDDNVERFTIVETGCSYGSDAPKEMITLDGKRWFRAKQYASSGECECPAGSCGDDETVGEDSTEGMAQCPLCEADAGEKHGYIYVGDGCETVYVHVDFACEECGVTQSEISPDSPTCDCDT